MQRIAVILGATVLACAASLSAADTVSRASGGDSFVAGPAGSLELSAGHDSFVAGSSIALTGSGAGDVHAAGFSVDVEAQTAGDLYAIGGSVTLRGDVGEDLSAMGFSVRSADSSQTAGNARLMGRSVTVEGSVAGALSAMGQEVVLNARIGGDALIVAEKITYGPKAEIAGRLSYVSPGEVPPPERVIAPERVNYEKLTRSEGLSQARKSWDRVDMPMLPGFMTMLAGFLITLAFFLIVGAIFLSFLPRQVEQLRMSITARPGMIFLLGVVGLSMLFGMLPISALTIVGLPFIPVIFLVTILAWTLGYILAAYAVGMYVWEKFSGVTEPSNPGRLLALALAVIPIAILNFIPFVGWIANYTLVLLGIGGMTNMIFERMLGNVGEVPDDSIEESEI